MWRFAIARDIYNKWTVDIKDWHYHFNNTTSLRNKRPTKRGVSIPFQVSVCHRYLALSLARIVYQYLLNIFLRKTKAANQRVRHHSCARVAFTCLSERAHVGGAIFEFGMRFRAFFHFANRQWNSGAIFSRGIRRFQVYFLLGTSFEIYVVFVFDLLDRCR